MTAKQKKMGIITGIVLLVAILVATITTLLVVFLPDASERVPKEYEMKWNKKDAFDVNDENMVSTIVIDKGAQLNILQITDVHYDHNNNKKGATIELINDVVARAKANAVAKGQTLDLITVTGDWTSELVQTTAFVKVVFDAIDSHDVPWAPVFGNHDMEGTMTRFDYIPFFASYDHSMFKAGYTNIGGVGNYIVNVREDSEDGKLVQSMIMMDSHTATKPGMAEYKAMEKGQVEWYEWTINGLNAFYKSTTNNGSEKVIPSLLFHHIPLIEHKTLYNGGQLDVELGYNSEDIWPAKSNSGLFDVMRRLGSTKASFVGHEHKNSSVLVYKPKNEAGEVIYEFRFIYGVQAGWCIEYAENERKGGTEIVFNQDGTLDIEWILYDLKNADYD